MTDPAATVRLTRVRATAFRARGGENFLIQLRGITGDGRVVSGMGEAAPRGARTGDSSASWDFLRDTLGRLDGRTIRLSDRQATQETVAELFNDLSSHAPASARSAAESARAQRPAIPTTRKAAFSGRRALKRAKRNAKRAMVLAKRLWHRPAPFEGTLLGVEAALVDLCSQVVGRQFAEAVGGRRKALHQIPHRNDSEEAVFERMLRKVTGCFAYPTYPAPTHQGRAATQYDEVPYLVPLGSNGTKGHLLEREALKLGLSTVRYSKGAFSASDGKSAHLLFKWSRSPRSSAVSLALCTHKEATRMLLRRAGVPVPRGRTFASGDFSSAKAFAERVGYPVVVKPAMGVRGIGVVANIADERELQSAFEMMKKSRLGHGDFIVEQHIAGQDYRIVVVGEQVIASILREPASVEGDGEHNIAELIANKNVFRHLNPHLWGRPIKYDDAAQYQLRRAGLTLTSVPDKGQRVLLSNTCSLSQGGDSIDVLDELHPSIKDACVKAVQAVPGLWFCGIDFLLEDHTRPLSDQRAGVCELNAHAAIGNCEYPLYGEPREVARAVMEGCVEHFGLTTNDKPAEKLALRLTIRGEVTGVGYRTWLYRHATSFGIRGWVRNIDRETLEAVLVGDATPTSALAAATVLGPRRATATSVTTEHIATPKTAQFEIREDKPRETTGAR